MQIDGLITTSLWADANRASARDGKHDTTVFENNSTTLRHFWRILSCFENGKSRKRSVVWQRQKRRPYNEKWTLGPSVSSAFPVPALSFFWEMLWAEKPYLFSSFLLYVHRNRIDRRSGYVWRSFYTALSICVRGFLCLLVMFCSYVIVPTRTYVIVHLGGSCENRYNVAVTRYINNIFVKGSYGWWLANSSSWLSKIDFII